MNIQVSVIIWTVICFVLLMLILKNLLFKPVLELMDKRKEKIKNASDKKIQLEELEREHEKVCLKEKEEAYLAHQKQVKEQIEEIRKQSKKDIEEARALRLKKIESYSEAAETQQMGILSEFSAHSEEIAISFAKSLIK